MAATAPTEEQLVSAIETDASDFNGWTALVEFYDKNDKSKLRGTYSKFLAEFPLLYVYWRKWAELEATLGNEKEARGIFEQGVSAVSASVDLWTAYCVFVAERSQNLAEIRSLFERAIEAVGDDFLAQTLWDKFIEFELSQEEYLNVSKLYKRVMAVPVRDLDRYWERYKAHGMLRPVIDLVETGEETQLQADADLLGPTRKNLDAEKKKIIFSWREKTFRNSQSKLEKRRQFEQGIKRSYFHVIPIDEAQLMNWKNYLEFEEKEGDAKRIVKLYERCLVPCAMYMDFWKKYAAYFESTGNVEAARKVLQRAATIFLKHKPQPQMALAEFEENQSNIAEAETIWQNLLATKGKGHVESILHAVQFYRRQGKLDEASQLFDSSRKDVEQGASLAFLDIQYAAFIKKHVQDLNKARTLYQSAVQNTPWSRFAWLAYVEFEMSQKNDEAVVHVFEQAVASADDLDRDDRIFVMERYLDYALNHSTVVRCDTILKLTFLRLRDIERRVSALKLSPQQQSNKRKADGPAADEKASKVAKVAANTTAQQGMPNMQNMTPAQQQYYQQYYAQYYAQQQQQQQ